MKEHAGGVPQPGDIIAGKYRVEQVLGAGGMGVVVAARHVALKQAVAVKFLLPQALKLQGASERFLREAQASVAITSEHVARVLDVGTLEGGAPYIVMECLSGTDLARLLKQRRMLAVHEAVDFVLQAGEAIAEAHTLGIVHRDLKPSNIFLTRRAEGSALVKVLDFGLSKMTAAHGDGDHSLTATDVVAGSPDYMSPEQVRSLKNVDGRTDLWALGVVLYELLTGKRPFHGPTPAAICASVAADRPLPLRALRADVPEGLDAAVLRCLEKDPGSRPQTVGELATSLAPFAPPESKASIERIVRLSPRAVGAWGDGMESVTMPLGARGAVTPAPAVPRNTPFAAAAPGPGVHAASAPTFAATAATGAESRSGERAAPTPTLNDVGAHPSGPTGGWGQTRPPASKGSILAIGGAAAAAFVVVAVVGWQVFGADAASGEGVSSASDPAPSVAPGVSNTPVAVTPGSAAVVPNVPVPPSASASAPPEPPALASAAPSSSVAFVASSQAPVVTASASASASPSAQPTSTGTRPVTKKPPPPPKPPPTTILDRPL